MFLLRIFSRIYVFLFHGRCYQWVIRNIPTFKPVYETRHNESPIFFRQFFKYKVRGENSAPYWPVHPTSLIRGSWRNIYVGIDAAPGVSPGCYIQAVGKVFIDDYAQIAPNVGIISANHFMLDIRKHIEGEVYIGKYSRIGMGSVILPGVKLGDFTTVAAGSIVNKSFPQGYCVIAGNPAEIVEDYSANERIKGKFLRYRNEFEYNGFIPAGEFAEFRKRNLNL